MLDLINAFATFPVLETDRLMLRAITVEDASDIFRIMADPLAMRYFGRAPMTLPEQALQRINETDIAFQDRSGLRWAITLREKSQLIGTCGFWRIMQQHDRAEMGYELAPEFWGQGIMPEAIAAILSFGFTTLGLHSVEAHIHPDNIGSRRVLEKVGFVQEGYFRENFCEPDGRFSDTAVFSLLKAKWVG